MKVKICGLTRLEDALCAHKNGAFALGFIFYPKSKRYITIDDAKDLLAQLPQDAAPIGVFVNQMNDVITAVKSLLLKGIQLHGDETPADCRRLRDTFDGFIIKAFRIQSDADLEAIARWCGYPAGSARALEEDYLRQTRNARKVYERLFFEEL